MIKVSVIITTCDLQNRLAYTIKSLLSQNVPASEYEIIIIDSGFSDNTKKIVKTVVSENSNYNIQYFFEPEPGELSGRHRGALESRGEILIFIDSNIEVVKGWLYAIMEAFKDQTVHLIGGPSLPKFEIEPPEWINYYDKLSQNIIIFQYFSLLYLGNKKIEIAPFLISGLNLSIRKKTFFYVGGFHPGEVPNHLICFRGDGVTGLTMKCKNRNLKSIYLPQAIVNHYIKREKLTVKYFEKLFYSLGISDSYAQIRYYNGFNKNIPSIMSGQKFDNPSIYELYKHIIYHRIYKAYLDGFCFHQEAVKKNEYLLKWVLRENYFDYRLPDLSISFNQKQMPSPKKNSCNKSFFIDSDSIIEKQLNDFKKSPLKLRQSYYDKTKKPLFNIEYFSAIKDQLLANGVNVNEIRIDIHDFKTWLTDFPEVIKYYKNSGDAFIEKCLEHYLVYKFLKFTKGDVYIDVAAAGSPWAEILNTKGVESYRLDLSYPKGIQGINIGANAENTGLPSGSCTALSLQCAYECFMGESDINFVKEASRILNEKGRYVIVPLYLADQYYISTSPYCDQKKVVIDDGAKKIWRDDQYKVPFSRHYSPEAFIERIYSNIPKDMSTHIFYISNLDELMRHYHKQRIYCFFMLYSEKKNTYKQELTISSNRNVSVRNTSIPKKIALFLFNYPLGVSETIVETILILAQNGYYVDVYIDSKLLAMSPISFQHKNINLISIPFETQYQMDLNRILSKLPHQFFQYINANTKYPHFAAYVQNIFMLTQKTKYNLLIGIEPLGLVSSYIISLLRNTPLVYYNMELFQRSNCKTREDHLLKFLEIEASNKCIFSVLPDKNRTRVFLKENNVSENKIRYLPVSTGGEPIYEKSNYFRKKFNIPDWKKILIYAGNLVSWAMCEELVEAGSLLPEEYVIVFHFWRERVERSQFLIKLKQKAASNIYFSLQPLPRDQFIQAISSADAGLMFYKPIDENFTETGSSSNKLATYLKAGLPVIASNFKSIREIFDRYKCGECATSPYEMKPAIDIIFSNYSKYKKGALKAFNDHYNFERNFSPLLSEISSICGVKKKCMHKEIDTQKNTENSKNDTNSTKKTLSNIKKRNTIIERLNANGITVDEVKIDLYDFESWLTKFHEIKKFYKKNDNVMIEKCLEHYLVFRYLKLDKTDIYIDIASAGSPWAQILNNKGIKSYKLDLSFPRGINGIKIGANAAKTGLPSGCFTALSLQCAYECFMGEADIEFVKEASRILNNKGRYAIAPLYLADQYYNSTSPFCDQSKVVIDDGAKKVWFKGKYKVPFCRHYSPESFIKRVYSNIPDDMSSRIFYFNNLDELVKYFRGQLIYCSFMLYCEKLNP